MHLLHPIIGYYKQFYDSSKYSMDTSEVSKGYEALTLGGVNRLHVHVDTYTLEQCSEVQGYAFLNIDRHVF